MIHVVYVMHPGGMCLLEHRFGELELNPLLISGFFSAIREFAKMLTGGKGEARVIEMGEFFITFAAGEYVAVAAIVEKTDNRLQVLNALEKIIEGFTKNFKEVIREWDGKLVFFSFVAEINLLLKNGLVGETATPTPRLKRKLPRLMVKIGQISENEYRIAFQCNGKQTPAEIAQVVEMLQHDVEAILHKLNKLGLIEYASSL